MLRPFARVFSLSAPAPAPAGKAGGKAGAEKMVGSAYLVAVQFAPSAQELSAKANTARHRAAEKLLREVVAEVEVVSNCSPLPPPPVRALTIAARLSMRACRVWLSAGACLAQGHGAASAPWALCRRWRWCGRGRRAAATCPAWRYAWC